MSSEPSWEFSDAWIFAAIGSGRRGTNLRGVIGSADHYNHAIPTLEELRQALGRLTASGLVSSDGDKFTATAAGRRVWKRSRGDVYTRVTTLLEALTEQPLTDGRWDVSNDAVTEAHAEYARDVAGLTRIWKWPTTRRRT